MVFQPDYKNVVDAANNKRPARLPLYEHSISPAIMERVLGESFAECGNSDDVDDLRYFFKRYCEFFKAMTYDTVSYEFPITSVLPAKGAAIQGKTPGPIQNRKDFSLIDWDVIAQEYISQADKRFTMVAESMPTGMKAIGGIGYGVFEISEDWVGLEYLSYMQADAPDLFDMIYNKIGDLMVAIWQWFVGKYSNTYCICRFGDDLGYKSGLLSSPTVICNNIIPQYHRIIEIIHKAGIPFLWHSCGNIFEIMNEVIAVGIDAKHSNEDIIAPFDEWIERYGSRIGIFGGIDVDILCQRNSSEIFDYTLKQGQRFRSKLKGYALGSGNSIPEYVPVDSYVAMVEAVQKIRSLEQNK